MSNIYYANIINPNILQSTVLDPVSNPMASNLDLGMNQIVNVGEASDPNGVPTLSQVNSLIASSTHSASSFTGNATFDINMNDNDLLNVKHLHLATSGSTSVQVSADVNGNVLLETAKVITSDNIASYIPAGGFTGNATFDIDMNDHNINNVQQIDFAGGSTNSLSTLNNNLVYNGHTVLTTQTNVTVAQTLDLISNVGSYSILLDATEANLF